VNGGNTIKLVDNLEIYHQLHMCSSVGDLRETGPLGTGDSPSKVEIILYIGIGRLVKL
jgi:hypothetical protein